MKKIDSFKEFENKKASLPNGIAKAISNGFSAIEESQLSAEDNKQDYNDIGKHLEKFFSGF